MSDFNDLLKPYVISITDLSETIFGLSDADLDKALDDQSWTIRQIVHHIVDGDDLWNTCIKAVLGNNKPFNMQWYWDISQDEWAEIWQYTNRDVTPALNLLRANREHIVQLLNAIPNSLNRELIIQWPEGEQKGSISDVIMMQSAHVASHIEEIQAIRKKHSR